MAKKLGAYFVPLHLYSGEMMELSESDVAREIMNHRYSMIQRSRGRGFRLLPGHSPKRKKPRKGHGISALQMEMNGLAFVARYGSKEPCNEVI